MKAVVTYFKRILLALIGKDLNPSQANLPAFQTVTANPEKDLRWMFDLIDLFIANEKVTIDILQKKVLTDNDIIEISSRVTRRIYVTVSDDYMNLVHRYIDPDELLTLIGEIVVRNLIKIGLQVNRQVMSADALTKDVDQPAA